MKRAFFIPAGEFRTEEIIKRSRFIVSVAHAASEDEARAFIARIRGEFSDANHNCWAYNAGSAGDTARVGMSDDGEPHGTAGRPMLNMLLHSDVGEAAVVVTRYFGGVKLGTGGLVRAYAGMVKLGLDTMPKLLQEPKTLITVTAAYADAGSIRRGAELAGAEVLAESFEADVRLVLGIAPDGAERLRALITDMTGGRCRFEEE